MVDPRLATLGISLGIAAFIGLVRDRRGAPPAPGLDVEISTGIELTVSTGGTIKTHRFGRRVLVGRAPSADLRLDDPQVSRLHARIEMRDDGVYVEDLGSRNGTRVDGAKNVQGSRCLRVDEEIEIGAASIIFRGVGAWR
jgi:pSer/pThr/pTyr-binding forkhead associated (FHA) protein